MKTRMRFIGPVLCLGILTAALVQALDAAAPAPKSKGTHDWPQWRGPKRDNVSTETGLLKSWPEGGPQLLWTSEDAGLGYSGPAVVGNRLYTMGGDEEKDFVVALDTNTGRKLWSKPIGPYVKNNWGGGPRGTPTVDGECLYALSSSGKLACLKTENGEEVWTVTLDGAKPGWNYSESPLVDGDQVVCSPGGRKGTLAAFDKNSGKQLWRSTELTDPAGYSSIVPATVGGIRHYVQLTMKGIAGVSAKNGRLLWYYPNPKYRTAVIPTAIVRENYVYAAAGYGAGAVLLKLTPEGEGIKAEQLYTPEATSLMDNKHGGVLRSGDYVYGASDRGGWTCQEFLTGKKMWQYSKFRKGSLTCADGNLYCYSEDNGTLVLVPASPEGWQEKGRFSIPRQSSQRSRSGGVWTHPVIANGKLYLRDQELIFCYKVK